MAREPFPQKSGGPRLIDLKMPSSTNAAME